MPTVVGGVLGDGVVGAGIGPAHAKCADNRNKTSESCQDVGYSLLREPWLMNERMKERQNPCSIGYK